MMINLISSEVMDVAGWMAQLDKIFAGGTAFSCRIRYMRSAMLDKYLAGVYNQHTPMGYIGSGGQHHGMQA
ncbi:MAG: hypothetical protein ACI4O7_10080 [Aristaeellaceae bacterium]